jgi:putative heme transporter
MSTQSGHSNSESDSAAQRYPIKASDVSAELAWKLSAIISLSLVVGLLFLDVLALVVRPLGVLFAAIVVALTLAPLVDLLERRMPRFAAVMAVYAALILILIGIGFVILSPLVAQAGMLVEKFPEYYRDVQIWLAREMGMTVRNDMDQIAMFAGAAADYLVALPAMILSTGAELIVGFFVSLYWLYSMPRLKAFGLSLFPLEKRTSVDSVMGRIGDRMGGYMRGVIITGVAVGAAVYIGLSLLGIQYALLLALLAFLGEFFPNVGPILAGIPAVLIAFLDSPGMAVAVLVFYIVVQQIESYILVPLIMMRTQAHIPPLVTTFAVFTGFMVGGVLWAILAIPLAGAILTIVTDVVAPAIRARTGAPEPEPESEPGHADPAEASPALEGNAN